MSNDKLTKDQRRKRKVEKRRKARNASATAIAAANARKLAKANEGIMAAVEEAVARASKILGLDDLAARDCLAALIRDHLYMPAEAQPAKPATAPVPAPAAAPAPPKRGFDKSAWGTPPRPATNGAAAAKGDVGAVLESVGVARGAADV